MKDTCLEMNVVVCPQRSYHNTNQPIGNKSIMLKVLSHQIRSAWRWFGWIGLDQYKDRGWLKYFLILLPFANLNFSSPSGIAKHDRCCMHSQIPQANLQAVLDFVYLKVLKVSSVSVVQNEQSNPEITFVKLFKNVCLLFKTHCKG